MRTSPGLDLHLIRLTVAGVPPTVWQMLDRKRRPDLALLLAEDRETTIEVAEAVAASRGGPRASRQLPRGSVDPRHCTALNGHVRDAVVSVERLPT